MRFKKKLNKFLTKKIIRFKQKATTMKLNKTIITGLVITLIAIGLYVLQITVGFPPSSISGSAIKGVEKVTKYRIEDDTKVELEGEEMQVLLQNDEFQALMADENFTELIMSKTFTDLAQNPDFLVLA